MTKLTPHDPEPWVTEDGKRQNTSVVPYRLGARTYADHQPRPVLSVAASELRPGDELLVSHTTKTVAKVGHDFKRRTIDVALADGTNLRFAPFDIVHSIRVDTNTERG